MKRQSIPSWLRRKVEQRDQGICAGCNMDTWKARRVAEWAVKYFLELGSWEWDGRPLLWQMGLPASFAVRPYEIDHIHPISLGGQNVIDNLRTLCRICHQKHTKVLLNQLTRTDRIQQATVDHRERLEAKY